MTRKFRGLGQRLARGYLRLTWPCLRSDTHVAHSRSTGPVNCFPRDSAIIWMGFCGRSDRTTLPIPPVRRPHEKPSFVKSREHVLARLGIHCPEPRAFFDRQLKPWVLLELFPDSLHQIGCSQPPCLHVFTFDRCN